MADLASRFDDGNGVPIILCADDYGISPAVSESILALIEKKRVSATSCMTVSPHWPAQASSLSAYFETADIGLHLTLTEQEALAPMSGLAPDKRLPSLGKLMSLAYTGNLDISEIRQEILRQFDAFENATGRSPHYVDGHHHIHQLPIIREALLEIAVQRLEGPKYVRVCRDSALRIINRRVSPIRASIIGGMGMGLKRRCAELGLRSNSVFAGVYDFSGHVPYGDLFARFCAGQKPNGLIMCHPGFVDEELRAADTLCDQRIVEQDFLMSEGMLETLALANLSISRFQA